MNNHQTTEQSTEEAILDENQTPSDKQFILQKEKSIFQEPIFYAALVAVGIAGYLITRKTQENIRRKRLRASRRFRGTDFAQQRNGQYEWEEEEIGIGI